jgi:hypothetical protein
VEKDGGGVDDESASVVFVEVVERDGVGEGGSFRGVEVGFL